MNLPRLFLPIRMIRRSGPRFVAVALQGLVRAHDAALTASPGIEEVYRRCRRRALQFSKILALGREQGARGNQTDFKAGALSQLLQLQSAEGQSQEKDYP